MQKDNKDNFRLLLVDDDEIFGRNFAAILNDSGYTVTVARNGNRALDKINSQFYDLVLLDVKLPDVNGIDILDQIRVSSPQTKVILLTAYPYDSLNIKENQEGIYAYFCKPFNLNAILETIKKFHDGVTEDAGK